MGDIRKIGTGLQVTLLSNQFPEEFKAEFAIYPNTIRFRLIHPLRSYSPFPFNLVLDETPDFSLVDNGGRVEVKIGTNLLRITKSPFSFTIAVDGKDAISFNSRSYLWTDPLPGTAPALSNPSSDSSLDDLRSELIKELGPDSFKSTTDSKPHGAASSGFDLSFPGTNHLYGLPEHASSFALLPTRGKGGSGDPYRMYNLDVFEYELNSKMALYGSVPFMMAHRKGLTTGVVALTASEMWVDVEKRETGMSTHWMGETGGVDLFFLLV